MPVTERRARTDDAPRHLALVTSEWSTREVEFADDVIDRFFAGLRHAYVDIDERRASG